MESYNYTKMSYEDKAEIDDRIALEHGELVPVKEDYLENETYVVEAAHDETDPESGETVHYSEVTGIRRVHKQHLYHYYVGKIGAGELGGIIGILGAIFVNGSTAKQEEARQDNLVFLEFLDEYHIELLMSIILREDRKVIHKLFDLEWVIPVVATFFKYNSFFKLADMLMASVSKQGITAERARNIALGGNAS